MPAPVAVTLYFDPISPYAWLASKHIDQVEAHGVSVTLQPVLFAGLLNAHGQKGPAEIPAKRLYTFRDVMREAARLDLPFRGPPGHPFNPLLALRLCLAVPQPLARRQLALKLMAATWEDGANLSDPAQLQALADSCGLDGTALLHSAASATVKQALADATAAAIAAGVFGVPTWRVGDELFWGGDRIAALHHHLAGARIDDANLQRFLALPPLAVRKAATTG